MWKKYEVVKKKHEVKHENFRAETLFNELFCLEAIGLDPRRDQSISRTYRVIV
jgi:hypothetical protein